MFPVHRLRHEKSERSLNSQCHERQGRDIESTFETPGKAHRNTNTTHSTYS